MEPFISVGQKIKIAPFSPKTLKRFDTLVFWQKDKFICHFFYKTDRINGEEVYFTKALNGKKLDAPFKEEHILGVVTDPKLPSWKRFFMRWIF